MLQLITNQNVLLYGVALFGILGVISQVILRSIYERLIKDMANMSMPKGKFMKQLKQKYQSFRRLNEGAANVEVFIRKSVMEYQAMGMSLHTWRKLGGMAFVLCAAFGIGGYYLTGLAGAAQDMRMNYLWATAAAALLIAASYGLTDNGYRRKYLITGLENVFTNTQVGQAYQEVDVTEKEAAPLRRPEPAKAAMEPKRKRGKVVHSQAQRDKQELKENLAKLKEGISETAAGVERSKERNTEILKQMDPSEQERVIREVLKEFLS